MQLQEKKMDNDSSFVNFFVCTLIDYVSDMKENLGYKENKIASYMRAGC